MPPLAIIGGRRHAGTPGRRRGFVALPPAATMLVVDAWGTGPPVVVAMYPGPGGDGADAEPDEAGGTTEHVVVAPEMVVVPIRVVVWHKRDCEEEGVFLVVECGGRMGFL